MAKGVSMTDRERVDERETCAARDRGEALEPRVVFGHPRLDGMNFLNESPRRYPGALNFASGRPEMAALHTYMPWVAGALRDGALSSSDDGFLQYGPTAGLICDLLAQWIEERNGVEISSDDVIVTTGGQEAIAIAVLALCDPSADALLVPDPTYLGIHGAASTLGIEMIPVGPLADIDERALRRGVALAAAAGRRARALYLIPDYDNPTGDSILAETSRAALVEAAAELGIAVLEDVAYRELGLENAPRSLLALGDNVVQLGTFAKLLFPALRLGYIAVRRSGRSAAFVDACRSAKSFLTLNTSSPSQAIVAYVLRHEKPAFSDALAKLRAHYRIKRETVLGALAARSELTMHGVTWNEPQGGFFLRITVPFAFGESEMIRCADEFGVLCTPMRYFSLRAPVDTQIRISYSAVSPGELVAGISRLATFIGQTASARTTVLVRDGTAAPLPFVS